MNKRREISNVNFFGSLVVLAGLAFSLALPAETRVRAETAKNPETVSENGLKKTGYGKMPRLFEENKGQTDRAAKFISRGAGYTLYLTPTEAVFQLRLAGKSDDLRLKFVGANQGTKLAGDAPAETKSNYYTGRKRIENVPNFKRVNYKNLYNGIDAVFYGNASNQLEYDFMIAPNADANQIRLNFEGAKNVAVDQSGNLVVKTENTELVQQKPFAYQTVNGEKREIAVAYKIDDQTPKTGDRKVSFAIGEYDRSQPLTIDPVLSYLTYLGGSLFERADSIEVDQAGNAFVVGTTNSIDFPAPNSRSGDDDFAVFVSKISPDGQSLIYNTFLDGGNKDGITSFDIGFTKNDIAIDASGNAYIAGVTESGDFPISGNGYQQTRLCARQFGVCIFPEEAFVTKLNAQGSIVYSTFLGGRETDFANSIAVDSAGKAYVTGGTRSGLLFPTKNQYQGTGFFGASFDAFLTVLNASGSDITYSTGLGGYSEDKALDVALDSSNNVYVTGFTDSEGTFPTKNAAQAENGGGLDAFVAKFNAAASGENSLIYCTFLGGGGTEKGFGVAVAANGTASVTGVTGSFSFPLKNAFDSTNQINEAFVTQYNSSGAMLNSTFLGGADQDEGLDIALGSSGTIYVTGSTLSSNFPTAVPFQATRRGLRDAFVAKIRFGVNNNPGVSSSSFLGGSGNDNGKGIALKGNFIFLTGETQSNNLLTTGGVIKPTSNASSSAADGYVAKILDSRLDTIGTFDPAGTVFKLKNSLAGGAPDITVDRGVAGDVAVAGDFNGDGIDTVSTFNNGVWKIINFNVLAAGYGTGALTVNFGAAGDLPVVGDWNGDGIDTPGVYRPSAGQFFLTNAVPVNNATPNVDVTVTFGIAEDLPVGGDWNADGVDSVGVFRPSAGQFFLTDDNILTPNIDQVFNFGVSGDLPVAGDWDGNGVDNIGVWRPSTTEFFLTNDHINISNQFVFGAGVERPVAGDWDGKPLP